MNHLPKVLQTEIWEYVHGDRAFWKQQFRACLIELDPWPQDFMTQQKENRELMCDSWKHMGDYSIRLKRIPKRGWNVDVYERQRYYVPLTTKHFKLFRLAIKEYHDQIRFYAQKLSIDPHFSNELAENMACHG